MAYKKEMFIKAIEGKSGKEYTCTLCGKQINLGDNYSKVNTTSVNNETGGKKTVVVVACEDHNIETSISASTK